jgi:uncharacterized protein
MDDHTKNLLILRHELAERFGIAALAFSADGRTIHFTAPLDCGIDVGGFAVVVTDDERDDTGLVVQIRNVQLVEREGPQLDMALGEGVVAEAARSVTVRPLLRVVSGEGAVIGSLDAGSFRAEGSTLPFTEQFVRPAHADEIATIIDGLEGDAPSIEIGVLRQAPEVPARLRSKGFSRHTFMCGQSGSGKTYTTGALFERLLADTTLPLVILDPNSDHVHLGSLRDPADRSPEAERYRSVAPSVKVARMRGLDASFTLCADFGELALEWQALLLRLHPIRDSDEFEALRRITGTLPAAYSIDAVVAASEQLAATDPTAGRIAQRIGNLGLADWDVWRRGDELSLTQVDLRSQRCVVFDLGSFSRPDERTTVALALLGTRWALRAERSPVLIAIDEAHNVLPANTDDPLLQATSDLGVLIAGEGRKFGLHLFVATQRPGKVHPNVVSQCDNLVLMRMNGATDVDQLVSLFSHVPEAMLREALGFGLGQALFAGPIAPVPLLTQVGTRLTPEGGGDVPTTWTTAPGQGTPGRPSD